MAHQRNQSMGDSLKSPHSVSLKVLRLSRPSLATQHALPNAQDLGISPKASLAYPSGDANTNDAFILSPVLNLPEAFGSAYVGETFSCTLCANNELDPADASRTISGVRIQGDMQTPSNPAGSPLDLAGAEGEDAAASPGPGESLQRILRFELKEEGNHVLAVTVTYTETVLGEGRAASGRVRTFRKLYQFVAQQLLSVRTKAGELGARGGVERWLLEAQLENMGEGSVALEAVSVTPKAPLRSTSLNWDMQSPGPRPGNAPILTPHDVIQVAFLLDHQPGSEEEDDAPPADRRVLGQMQIQWRSALGDRGSLSTGWLTSRR
ncbi:hypothetical protein P153DRAFT_296181 [Dothidotthia symphoricarpi CBS 119687]|uniref:DUF974 domain-containing protein n=1 Tax=Dothidotthia symphoricarpi CBS 119687 TaxID=1392245 RepID=A0A6A6A8I0_9PLEO|nr:uncharacterized protein P153DRAFT_296181 [Dothidotthia symphoricarpi CBS 119687]KAF2127127.1 hypothetical protein P153DRAFT_296181 [Dothidotthia symphoricarpi CBS 119687]